MSLHCLDIYVMVGDLSFVCERVEALASEPANIIKAERVGIVFVMFQVSKKIKNLAN